MRGYFFVANSVLLRAFSLLCGERDWRKSCSFRSWQVTCTTTASEILTFAWQHCHCAKAQHLRGIISLFTQSYHFNRSSSSLIIISIITSSLLFFYILSQTSRSQHQYLWFVSFSSQGTHSATHTKLLLNQSSSCKSCHFYYTRLARLWNFLPPLDLSLSLTAIKNRLQRFFWDHFLRCFDPDDVCTFHVLCPCSNCHLRNPAPMSFHWFLCYCMFIMCSFLCFVLFIFRVLAATC